MTRQQAQYHDRGCCNRTNTPYQIDSHRTIYLTEESDAESEMDQGSARSQIQNSTTKQSTGTTSSSGEINENVGESSSGFGSVVSSILWPPKWTLLRLCNTNKVWMITTCVLATYILLQSERFRIPFTLLGMFFQGGWRIFQTILWIAAYFLGSKTATIATMPSTIINKINHVDLARTHSEVYLQAQGNRLSDHSKLIWTSALEIFKHQTISNHQELGNQQSILGHDVNVYGRTIRELVDAFEPALTRLEAETSALLISVRNEDSRTLLSQVFFFLRYGHTPASKYQHKLEEIRAELDTMLYLMPARTSRVTIAGLKSAKTLQDKSILQASAFREMSDVRSKLTWFGCRHLKFWCPLELIQDRSLIEDLEKFDVDLRAEIDTTQDTVMSLEKLIKMIHDRAQSLVAQPLTESGERRMMELYIVSLQYELDALKFLLKQEDEAE